MNKLVYQLFVGKICDEIGEEKTMEILKSCKTELEEAEIDIINS